MRMYPNYYKKKFRSYIHFFFFFWSNMRMMNLSLDELRLIAQIRNISDYQSKSKEDLIKALSEPEPDTKPKADTKQTQNWNQNQK